MLDTKKARWTFYACLDICMSTSVDELLFEGIFHLVKYTGHFLFSSGNVGKYCVVAQNTLT